MDDEISVTELYLRATMGLGPSVCKKCMVYTSYKPHPTIKGRQGTHYCPICLSENWEDHTGLWQLPKDVQEDVYDNTEFLRFMQGVPSARKSN